MATIKLYIAVANISETMEVYDQIKIFRSTSATGTYSEITIAATRIPLIPGKSLYNYYDHGGTTTSWYKTKYFNSSNARESEFSDPVLGDDSEAIDYIMSVQRLKDVFLTGVDLTDDTGAPYPDIMFEFAIRAAIAWAEHQIEVDVRPQSRTERHDYDRNRYTNWMTIYTEHYPIIDISSVKLYWPSTDEAITFPTEWISAKNEFGQINLVPTSGTLATALLTIGGSFLPFLLGSYDYLPNAIEVVYRSGFLEGALPYDIRALIGMRACYPILNTAGDLIAGAGVANFSLSMDGISQSIGTTSSATNAGYGARLIQFEKEIKEQLPKLKKYYKGVRLEVA